MTEGTADQGVPTTATETTAMAPEPDPVVIKTPDMAPGPDPVVATETPEMVPGTTEGEKSGDGQIDVFETIVTCCTGFFNGDEETIREFGEDPEGWCAANLPPGCGPQDIARCMPEIMERCEGSGGGGSSHELARYCGTYSQHSASTYSSHGESSGGTYSSGSDCACDTVVNEICYTVNVYHQTNIYTHREMGGTTTDCFGDRTPCTTPELDDKFDCEYTEEVPTWHPSTPGEIATETSDMAPEADGDADADGGSPGPDLNFADGAAPAEDPSAPTPGDPTGTATDAADPLADSGDGDGGDGGDGAGQADPLDPTGQEGSGMGGLAYSNMESEESAAEFVPEPTTEPTNAEDEG